MEIKITHGGKLPLDIRGWIGEKSFTHDCGLNTPGIGPQTSTGGYF